jgi:hypothetical protein
MNTIRKHAIDAMARIKRGSTLLDANAKMQKTTASTPFSMVGMNLSPARESGMNTCTESGECEHICISTTGQNIYSTSKAARVWKTRWFFGDKSSFLAQLHRELGRHEKRENPVVRLNTLSDLPWEVIDRSLFDRHPDILFLDYTKHLGRCLDYVRGRMPGNYHLSYSWSERSRGRARDVNDMLRRDGRCVVVAGVRYNPRKPLAPLPQTWRIGRLEWPVFDADRHDLRLPETGERGCVSMVRAKASQANVEKYTRLGFFQALS